MRVIRTMFVCTGNICRSPTAEGVFRAVVRDAGLERRIEADSAGTIAFHAGAPPDSRARRAAARRGIGLDALRARQVRRDDFAAFDYLLAMDREHLQWLQARRPRGCRAQIALFLAFADRLEVDEVPDPYYGDDDGFEQVLDLVEAGARALLAHIRSRDL